MLVLFAAISSFAQMWTSLAIESNQPESGYYMEGYLKAYTMMVRTSSLSQGVQQFFLELT
jgi:hypothetical protein